MPSAQPAAAYAEPGEGEKQPKERTADHASVRRPVGSQEKTGLRCKRGRPTLFVVSLLRFRPGRLARALRSGRQPPRSSRSPRVQVLCPLASTILSAVVFSSAGLLTIATLNRRRCAQ